jgi:hypothetical protein
VVLLPLAKCRIRRLVRWLSLSFREDFGLLPFKVRGLTCAAQIAGARNTPPNTTNRRRQRAFELNISGPSLGSPAFLMIMVHEACQSAGLDQ